MADAGPHPSRIPFHKLHGLGNDFAVIDLRASSALAARLADTSTATALCDRHRGIGADGLLLVTQGEHGSATMRVINADGSEPEMCGNGIRCVAKFLHDAQDERPDTVDIDTAAGLKRCDIVARTAAGEAAEIRVSMGAPEFGELEQSISLPKHGALKGSVVSMGNPHFVHFLDPGTGRDRLETIASELGLAAATHAAFPNGTNVEFASVQPNGVIDVVVWERGCGITQACGTGACATAAAAKRLGLVDAETTDVVLPGGTLCIAVTENYGDVLMTGPATLAYCGTFSLTH